MPSSKETIPEVLVKLHWSVSAVLGVGSFAVMRWVLPAHFADQPFTASWSSMSRGFAWIPLLVFGGLAAISALRASIKRRLVDRQHSLESLRKVTWQQFELMVAEAYQRKGYQVEESLRGGADGGIDLVLRKQGRTYLVQCKNWRKQSVGAPIVREQLGLRIHHQADGSIIITSGHFTREAIAFAEANEIELVDGSALLELIKGVQRPLNNEPSVLATKATSPGSDPICPRCGSAMVLRKARRGANAGNTFWGCSTYPQCRGTLDSN